jgi:hypothetical protein
MTYFGQAKIKKWTIIIYLTIAIAAGQSILSEVGTTDNGHKILSTYFFIEITLLGLLLLVGLKNKWTRVLIGLLTFLETALFIADRPVSPDEMLMILIFGLRLYVLIGLFSKEANQYYRTDKT